MSGMRLEWIFLSVLGLALVAGLGAEVIRVLWSGGRVRAALNLVWLLIAALLAWGMWQHSQQYDCHVTCDFAGQWLMGRMFVRGDMHLSYTFDKEDPQRGAQWQALADGYDGGQHTEMYNDIVLKNTWGGEVYEGPLYPPPAGFLFAPLAMVTDGAGRPDPKTAHARLIEAQIGMGILSALLISWGSRRQMRFGEAALLIFAFPNFTHSILLGQNPPLSLLILCGGWALWARGYPLWGGVVWGLLVYKPVFSVAVVWVPLLLLSGRMFLGMIGSSALLCLMTLPFCLPPEQRSIVRWDSQDQTWRWTLRRDSFGLALEPWHRWYIVGQNARRIYDVETNWTFMSRDVYTLPRRKIWHGEDLKEHLAYALYFDREVGRFTTNPPRGENMWKDKVVSGYVELFPKDGCGLIKEHVVKRPENEAQDGHGGQNPLNNQATQKTADSETAGWLIIHVTDLGFGLMGLIFMFTVLMLLTDMLRRVTAGVSLKYAPVGNRIGFLLLGALLTTFHFMHYDLLLFALPVAMILGGRHTVAGWLWLGIWCLVFALMSLDLAILHQSFRMPLETPWLILLWLWSGFAMITERLPQPVLRPVESAYKVGPAESA